MKYIRTKDGKIIKSLTEIEEAYDKVPVYIYTVINNGYKHCCNIQRDFVEKVADTIEELCDEFVLKKIDLPKPLVYTIYFKDLRKYAKDRDWTIYGAIWTDKGLIYVAKMEGVLPNGKIDGELL